MSLQAQISNTPIDTNFFQTPGVGFLLLGKQTQRHADKHTDMATLWPTRPRGSSGENKQKMYVIFGFVL